MLLVRQSDSQLLSQWAAPLPQVPDFWSGKIWGNSNVLSQTFLATHGLLVVFHLSLQ
jgi:hypothetical protein